MFTKLSISMLALLVGIGSAQAGSGYKKLYIVTIQNLTSGQPLTPAVIAVHSPESLFAHMQVFN